MTDCFLFSLRAKQTLACVKHVSRAAEVMKVSTYLHVFNVSAIPQALITHCVRNLLKVTGTAL